MSSSVHDKCRDIEEAAHVRRKLAAGTDEADQRLGSRSYRATSR